MPFWFLKILGFFFGLIEKFLCYACRIAKFLPLSAIIYTQGASTPRNSEAFDFIYCTYVWITALKTSLSTKLDSNHEAFNMCSNIAEYTVL
jgi:hypothetical protein